MVSDVDLDVDVTGSKRPRIISTGAAELDKKMGGGLPLASLSLIEGESGAGKSTLTQHLMWGALNTGQNVSLYTTENTIKSYLRQTESLGMDMSDYYLLDFLRVYPIKVIPHDTDPEEAFQALGDHMEGQPEIAISVLDSLSTLLTQATENQILSFFARCKSFCDAGKAIICTTHSHAFDERVLTRVRSLCDVHLRLVVEPGASELVKSMEVSKIKGAEMNTGAIVSFAIEPGIGMRIIPISKAKA